MRIEKEASNLGWELSDLGVLVTIQGICRCIPFHWTPGHCRLRGNDPRGLSTSKRLDCSSKRADGIWGEMKLPWKSGGCCARALAEAGCPKGSRDKAQAAD